MEALLDIVIPTFNRADWLELCVAAVKNFTKHAYHLVVCDNKSTEPSAAKLFERLKAGEFGRATVLHLAENKSFSSSVNAGIRAGKAPNVVILNNDAIVTPGWDSHFLQDLSDPRVGMTGARSNAASGLQSDSCGLANVVEARVLVYVCVAIRREILDKVGLLDEETFTGFSCEDLDHAWRIRWGVPAGVDPKVTLSENHGPQLKLKVSNAYVLHGLSQTLSQVVGDAAARAQNDLKYQIRLADKWGMDFVNEQCKARPRVMVVTYSAEEWTRTAFLEQVMGLRRGTAFDIEFTHITRLPIHIARQKVAEGVVKHGFDWLIQLDDDATFPPDVINRLMAHNKDVVCALAYGRKPPHNTCVFSLGADGMHGDTMPGIERTGLRKVDISGFHVSAIKVDVFRRLEKLGVKKWYGNFEEMGEDFHFSHVLLKAKIPLYVDTDLIAGHMGSGVVVDEAYKRSYVASTGVRA